MFATASGNNQWECSALGYAPAGLWKAVSVTSCSTTAGQSEMLLKLGGFHWWLRETYTLSQRPESTREQPHCTSQRAAGRTPEEEVRRKRK